MFARSITIALVWMTATAISAAAGDVSDKVQGNWLGTWAGKGGMGGKNVAQIYGLGDGTYQAVFTAYDSGEQDSGVFTFSIRGSSVSEDKVVFEQNIDLGPLGAFTFLATVEKGKLAGKYSNGKNYEGTLDLKRVDKKLDAIGATPLPGAVVLFDGKTLEGWKSLGETPADWKVVDGLLVAPESPSPETAKTGHLASLQTFRDAQIHLEFRVPYLPEKRGQERGQSGLFLHGRYELQILDSFGFPRPKDGLGEYADVKAVGAVFGQRAPKEMPALPPGEWQAFDITFTAAKVDAEGKVTKPAEMTVVLNGTQIHDRVPLSEPTADAPIRDTSTIAGLILQNAGQPVEFRNIWFVPLDSPGTK